MVNSITNLTEEIYISIYEIAKTSNPLTTEEYPKIYPTHCLMEEEYEPASIPGFYAINPTEQGLKLLISACEFKGKGNYSSDNLSIFASQIFSDIAEHQREMMSKVFSDDLSVVHYNQYERYRKYRTRFQARHPIRIAIVAGLHRTALATHLLGNWTIHNAPPRVMSTSPSEELTKKSPLNFSISVHILSPQPSGANFSNDFLGELRKLSEDVNNRTYKQNKMMKSGQLFDILRNTPDNIAKLQFIPSEQYVTKQVNTKL